MTLNVRTFPSNRPKATALSPSRVQFQRAEVDSNSEAEAPREPRFQGVASELAPRFARHRPTAIHNSYKRERDWLPLVPAWDRHNSGKL